MDDDYDYEFATYSTSSSTSNTSLWTSTLDQDDDVQQQHDEFVKQTEIDKYLTLPETDPTEKNDLLIWWKQRRSDFPILCILAKKTLQFLLLLFLQNACSQMSEIT
ncbi:10958_t:CDS:2 [Cetraspora pellucida]|uniref:10958_t:CDS:1 n=1 Tax=Cetraspora pellucida TaxID=1433469 RepID=A0ACA9LG26_9GLOM|nr:10958_t:CDS:2 [Cetraspora pellucida]